MAKLNDVRVLTVSAMMLALSTILGFLKAPVTELIELRFAFLPIACTGMLFGPAVATYRFFGTLNRIEIALNRQDEAAS